MKRWSLLPLTLAAIACAVPWLLSLSPEIGFALRRGFALVCHQQPERSFVLFGGSVAVCARCLGIYLGASIGLLTDIPRYVAWRLFLVAASINAIDGLSELSGLHSNWMFVRFLLGITLGATAGMLIIASIDKVKIPISSKGGLSGAPEHQLPARRLHQ